MNEEAVLARARQAGIAVDWIDAMGRPQRVRMESLRRILEALDGNARPSDGLPPLRHRARSMRASPLPNLSIEADTPAELALEDGGVAAGDDPARQGAPCPPIGRPGYHRLRFAGREITLAVAPPRCVTLDDIGAGRRLWGLAAQLYGLRRAGDGGIGDARRRARSCRGSGAPGRRRHRAQPGAQPVRRTIPARYGPYSPSSRLFLNPLLRRSGRDLRRRRVAAVHDPSTQLGRARR